jgi:hypothetical protein
MTGLGVSAAAACLPAGQLGAVGRQLGTILASIVQQLRNQKMQWGGPALTKVYDLVFGKVVSELDSRQRINRPAPPSCCASGGWRCRSA